jgi:hypothetical protein
MVTAAGLAGRIATRFDAHRFAGLDPRVLEAMQAERYRSGARAVRELGVPRTPIARSIEEALQWFRQQGYC